MSKSYTTSEPHSPTRYAKTSPASPSFVSFEIDASPSIKRIINLLSESKAHDLKLFNIMIEKYKTYCITYPTSLHEKAAEIAELWEYAYNMATNSPATEEKKAGMTALIFLMSNSVAKDFLSVSGKTELQSEIMTIPTFSKNYSPYGPEHFYVSDIFESAAEAEYYLIGNSKFEG